MEVALGWYVPVWLIGLVCGLYAIHMRWRVKKYQIGVQLVLEAITLSRGWPEHYAAYREEAVRVLLEHELPDLILIMPPVEEVE